jgi:hypothetical protein
VFRKRYLFHPPPLFFHPPALLFFTTPPLPVYMQKTTTIVRHQSPDSSGVLWHLPVVHMQSGRGGSE